jgi:VWFA-related protein
MEAKPRVRHLKVELFRNLTASTFGEHIMRLFSHRTALLALSVASSLAFFVAAGRSAAAQAPTPVPSGRPMPSGIAAADRRISIDAEVTDKLGHHISGLQAQDFVLLDNKQPTKILNFREVDSRSSAADPVHVVIVIDTINTGFDVVAREREQLTEFLRQDGGHLAHPTSLAIFTEKGIQLEKSSTTDGNALLASLNNTSTGLRIEGRNAGIYGAADRVQWSLSQLGELAAYEATQPGRKLAFFISPGWPLLSWEGLDASRKDRQWTFQSIVALTNGLREAHLALYTIDPFDIGRSNVFYYQSYLKGVTKPNDANYANLALQVLATHTGGLVEVTGMDIKGEIDKAVRDANAYYTLTFEAPPPDHFNEYHDLHLQVDKPGTTVRSTTGYYANTQFQAPR